MKIQEISVIDSFNDLPKPWKNTALYFACSFLSYFATQLFLVILGQNFAPLVDFVGIAIGSTFLFCLGLLSLLSKRIMLTHFCFALVGLVYIVITLRFASSLDMKWFRQLLFHSLPFILNGLALSYVQKWITPHQNGKTKRSRIST